MIQDVDDLALLLSGTILADQPLLALPIPACEHLALAIQLPPDQKELGVWELMHSLLAQTQRYPVITTAWAASRGHWQQDIMAADLFSRFYYEEESFHNNSHNTAPDAISARLATLELESLGRPLQALSQTEWSMELDYALTETQQFLGQAPTSPILNSLYENGTLRTKIDLERWLFDWELDHLPPGRANIVDLSYLNWFEPDAKTLVLLPTERAWEVLAYLHWFGACQVGTEVAMAFLQRWHQQFQAELICHYGTMLQLRLYGPLPTPTTAFQLAQEQYNLAPYTLEAPGISIRRHAQALLQTNRWFLHERPEVR